MPSSTMPIVDLMGKGSSPHKEYLERNSSISSIARWVLIVDWFLVRPRPGRQGLLGCGSEGCRGMNRNLADRARNKEEQESANDDETEHQAEKGLLRETFLENNMSWFCNHSGVSDETKQSFRSNVPITAKYLFIKVTALS